MDAVWRIFGYHTYPASNPPVITIKAKTSDVVQFYQTDGKSSDMFAYLARPTQLEDLTYEEMFQTYICAKKKPVRFKAACHENVDCFLIDTGGVKPFYIYKRIIPVLCRLEMLFLNVGEPWYWRLILRKIPVRKNVTLIYNI
jgi:hypothetical protein